MSNEGLIKDMESRYHCRYERGVGTTFPVTHVLDGPGRRRYAHICINNGELLNWCIMSETGERIVHSHEQNHGRTKSGYIRMIRRALNAVRAYGTARRVYPRDPAHRKVPAGARTGYGIVLK